MYYEVRDTFGKDVVIGETGWPNDAETHWGLFYENGTMKEYLDDVIPTLQHVTTRK